MYSMTMNDVPCSWPQSKMPTMFGWFRPAADWASRRNRSTNIGSRESSGESTLSATGRLSFESLARYTSAMPPCAISRTIS